MDRTHQSDARLGGVRRTFHELAILWVENGRQIPAPLFGPRQNLDVTLSRLEPHPVKPNMPILNRHDL